VKKCSATLLLAEFWYFCGQKYNKIKLKKYFWEMLKQVQHDNEKVERKKI